MQLCNAVNSERVVALLNTAKIITIYLGSKTYNVSPYNLAELH